jgi:outer membrane protein assembly factor BamB
MYRGDAVGSLTSHVMWTKPLQFGGVVGGDPFVAGSSNPDGAAQGAVYFEGSSYQPRFVNPIIINGYLFYTEPRSFSGPSSGPTDAVDLRTGQVLWSRTDVPQISFGYIYNLWDPDQHGTYPPILFTANFARAFDAYTGDQLFNVTGVPTSTTTMPVASVAGPGGEQIRYVLNNLGTTANPQWYLQQWNSSRIWIYDVNPFTGAGSVSPSLINGSNLAFVTTFPVSPTNPSYTNTITVNATIPINATTTAQTGQYAIPITTYDTNISLPATLNTMPNAPAIIGANYGDIILCRNGSLPIGFAASQNGGSQAPYTLFAINLNASKGAVGSILWMKNYNPPAGNITMQLPSVDYPNRVFVYQYYETMQWVGFNLDTGVPMWGPTEPETAFNYYDWSGYNPGVMAYGNLYSGGFGGVLYCFNDLTGELKWTYGNGGVGNSTYAGLNVFYGDYPSYVQAIANGVVYFAADEHTIPNPLYKGCLARALNATSGEEIWTLSEYPSEWSTSGSEWATADGFTTFMNGLDNNIYNLGRGPSATTIQAPLTQITAGNKVIVQGTVTDISAGTKQNQQAADFPSGVPVASDASMKDWMGYVYQQKPLPSNFTGVPVSIVAVDPNGNTIPLGTATTDANGLFHYTWITPNVSGDYTVTATFAGTNGYWQSNAVTAMTVAEAPQATAAPTQTPSSVADQYFLPVSIAIILVIIVVGAVLVLLLLRKRP